MQISPSPQLTPPDANDPLGFGLKSIPEPLQRWWLIGIGNPYIDAEVREARTSLGIPEMGFSNTTDFVDWVALRRSRHGHTTQMPISLTFDGQRLEGDESLIRFHHRDISWPIPDHEFPGPCCPSDPLFDLARRLAVRFGIDLAASEPGFPEAKKAVVGYLLVNRWPQAKSSRGTRWTEEYSFVDNATGERFEERKQVRSQGLHARGGAGRQLPQRYIWWKLDREGKEIDEISRATDSDDPNSKTYDERSIRVGIDAVEKMMRPVEKPSIP